MKAQIQITIPSLHALDSSRAFNLEHSRETFTGGMIFWQNFDTVVKARQYLRDKTFQLFPAGRIDVAVVIARDFCRYDAATAWIVTDRNEFFN